MNLRSMRLDVRDGLADLTFTEAARGNPIDGIFCAEIRDVSVELSERADVRAVLIKAEGKTFSVGGDIAAFTRDLDALPRTIKGWATDLHDAVARLQRIDAPIVAAVHGVCAGGMAAFVAGADIVVASPGARFVSAYTGIGFACDGGATVMLSRRMGYARARRYLLLGEVLNHEAALAAGLVDVVVEPDALIDHAGAIAARLAAGPTRSYGEIKRLFQSVDHEPIETQLALEAMAIARTAATQDARGALLAFRDKRPAVFSGR
ncbi:enoyl-CoA hydratase/isomerase family protein [Oleomonas cavernae]|uniref:Enoyl-CoA hydratase/isomerase family protein n=1 Tax=Oleomonas cavernae TaxID=2320859 RepID=A0A418WHF2_9PROT|nr:enoyl-CoA hydratase/isomerase family protein [Oleomonas cavernae]RJF89418.1 enoyl-CoA hydratase/isomerase family protein [Oleomonas cavernae]